MKNGANYNRYKSKKTSTPRAGQKARHETTSMKLLRIKSQNSENQNKAKPEIFAGHYTDENNQPLSFNLYDADENLNWDETKENLMFNMNANHLKPMQEDFSKAGLKLEKFQWYSPRAYNFSGDSVDMVIKIEDKEKLKRYIREHQTEIQKDLNSNKSRDGYMSLISRDVDEVIERIDTKNDIDPMVISYIASQHKLDRYDDFYDLQIIDEEEKQ